MANKKRSPDKANPYRSRVGRQRYNFMVLTTTLDDVRQHAVDLNMSYGGFIEWACKCKIKELQTKKDK